MSKDPAVLWYFSDWAGGTMTMTRHIKGCYMDLLAAQFNNGPLSLDEIKTVLGTDFGHAWPYLSKKFEKDESGLFYNVRLKAEREKRSKYSESRRKNAHAKHMHEHMGNENENINKDLTEDKGGTGEEGKMFHVEQNGEREKPVGHNAGDSRVKPNPINAFESVWEMYPQKIGRSRAFREFCMQLEVDQEIVPRIQEGVRRYSQHLGQNTWKKPMNFENFLAEWPDWETYEPDTEIKPESKDDALLRRLGGKK